MASPVLVSAVDGASLLGISERMFHELRRRPDFPQSRQLGPRCVRYCVAELTAWALGLPKQGSQPEPLCLAQKRNRAGSEVLT